MDSTDIRKLLIVAYIVLIPFWVIVGLLCFPVQVWLSIEEWCNQNLH